MTKMENNENKILSPEEWYESRNFTKNANGGPIWLSYKVEWYAEYYHQEKMKEIQSEIDNLKYMIIKGIPNECISGWDEVKFCSHRNGDGNKCMKCLNI